MDRGPGVAPEARDTIFVPFQRLGDRDNTTGVGLPARAHACGHAETSVR
ncbi:MAG: hypothetical protein ACRDQU_08905 [Pseudonocardiaceae bacterium]